MSRLPADHRRARFVTRNRAQTREGSINIARLQSRASVWPPHASRVSSRRGLIGPGARSLRTHPSGPNESRDRAGSIHQPLHYQGSRSSHLRETRRTKSSRSDCGSRKSWLGKCGGDANKRRCTIRFAEALLIFRREGETLTAAHPVILGGGR